MFTEINIFYIKCEYYGERLRLSFSTIKKSEDT
nr:MAG TPA: hypothetical protein [Caudoviricetes sp.]